MPYQNDTAVNTTMAFMPDSLRLAIDNGELTELTKRANSLDQDNAAMAISKLKEGEEGIAALESTLLVPKDQQVTLFNFHGL